MGVRIVIAGVSQDEIFGQVCLIADYLFQNLPNFCWERIENPVLEWEAWLLRVNKKNKWHHVGSPIIWKELLMIGSKPFYIGGAADFLEYCHSYYDIDVFLTPENIEGLTANFAQFKNKLKFETKELKHFKEKLDKIEKLVQTDFVVTITGAGHPITMHLISGLLDMSVGNKTVSKIYLFDPDGSSEFMDFVEQDCRYVDTKHAGKVVKYVTKIGTALTNCDLLIILDHVPFKVYQSIGDWLYANYCKMKELSFMINASAARRMYILLPNLGPACYNATVLTQFIQLNKNNVVVATSDLGLEISSIAAEIAEVPLKNMFCPPVWGFVGINHLVDIKTTVHRYDTLEPYKRYLKVRNSTLMIGCLTPEFRTLEYLMYFDENLWNKVAERKISFSKRHQQIGLHKVVSVLDAVKEWLFEQNPEHIVCLGIQCDGSFGLTFDGKFSQPARFVEGVWIPAGEYFLPKDPQMTLKHLQQMAEFTMKIKKGELPDIIPRIPCTCRRKIIQNKNTWF